MSDVEFETPRSLGQQVLSTESGSVLTSVPTVGTRGAATKQLTSSPVGGTWSSWYDTRVLYCRNTYTNHNIVFLNTVFFYLRMLESGNRNFSFQKGDSRGCLSSSRRISIGFVDR